MDKLTLGIILIFSVIGSLSLGLLVGYIYQRRKARNQAQAPEIVEDEQ